MYPHKFIAKLIYGQMHSSKATPANLLFDDILVYPVHGCIVAAAILRAGVERLLDALGPRGCSSVVAYGTLIRGRGPGQTLFRTSVIPNEAKAIHSHMLDGLGTAIMVW